MNTFVTHFLSNIRFGSMQQHQRMTIVPLIGPSNGPLYLTLAEALAEDLLKVTEVDEGGSVPELRVHNTADLPVLLLDGEEVAGAKQNRVLNTTILLKKQSKTMIPVSCTEQGRWSYTSPEFADSDTVMSPRMRSTKNRSVSESLDRSKQYRSDQGAIWDDIERLHLQAGTESPTSAMRDVYQSRRANLDDYLAAFETGDSQTGLLVMIDGAVVGMDILSQETAFTRIGPKLTRSYAMEALLGEPAKGAKPSIKTAERFLASIGTASAKQYESIGHGNDYRFTGANLVGSALIYRETVIHGAFFPTDDSSQNDSMPGPSFRRRFRM